MTKNPFINAVVATLYITLVASLMFYGTKLFGKANSFVVPIAVLSLFTLSAAIIGYLFLYQPLQLYLNGKKKHAINLFLQTLSVFAGITVLIFALLFFRYSKIDTLHTNSPAYSTRGSYWYPQFTGFL